MPLRDSTPTDWFGLHVAEPVPEPEDPRHEIQAARDSDACLRSVAAFYEGWDG